MELLPLPLVPAGLAGALGVFLATTLVVVAADWRLSLLGLFLDYLLVSRLLTEVIQPEVALIKVIAGGMASVILFITARQLGLKGSGLPRLGSGPRLADGQALAAAPEAGDPPPGERPAAAPGRGYLVSFPFRLVGVLLLGLVIYPLLVNYPRPEVGPYLNFAVYWLPAAAILVIILTTDPFKVGVGLLVFQLGFEAFYASLEGSLSVNGLLGITTLAVALTASYLMTAAHEGQAA